MNKAEVIESFLHETRSPMATLDTLHKLSAATAGATTEEIALAVHRYIYSLLAASRNSLELQADCAIAEQLRDNGELQ